MSLARKIAQKFKRVKLSDENVAALGEIMDVINAEGEEVADDLTSGESAAGDTHIHIHASGEPTITQGDEDPAAPSDVNTMDDEIAQVIAGITQRLDAIEQQLAKLATAEEQEVAQQAMGDEESEEEKAMADEVAEESSAPTTQDGKAVRDSRYLADSYQSTISGAEILAPGIRYPAFDSKARPAKTVMAVCDLRRRALDAAYMIADGRDIITSLTRGRAFDSLKLSCGEVRSMFLGAVTAKRAMNNSRKANDSTVVTTPAGPVLTPAELNKRNAAYWATH